MNLLKEILENEVYPALGCTEPVSVAFICAHTAKLANLKNKEDFSLKITMDPGTYKNGYAVSLPNSNTEKGNHIAAALGVLIKKPELKYDIFSKSDLKTLKEAKKLLKKNKIEISIDYTKKDIFIESKLKTKKNTAICALSKGHFNVSFMSLNSKKIKIAVKKKQKNSDYREFLKNMDFKDLINLANEASKKDLNYIEKGVRMNIETAMKGFSLDLVAAKLKNALSKGIMKDDVFAKSKILACAATDARMHGLPSAVMSSGQSGNQGVVATLVPYIYGKERKTPKIILLKSIALAHIINSYIKTFLGELSPVCGCAVSSGVGAASAIAYQTNPADIKSIENAAKNVISDIGGMLCDGAKDSCSLKVASSSDSALRAAFLAAEGLNISDNGGFMEKNFSDTIKNLARLSIIGMSSVDSIIIETMKKKADNA